MKAKRPVAGTSNPNTLAWRFRAACTAGLLSLLLVLPAVVQAQTYTNNYGIWYYTDNGDGTATIIGCGSGGVITIPDMIDGLPVTSIGNYAFAEYAGGPGGPLLTSVTIGSNVTSIGDYAFNGCTSLTNVMIPDSVTSIGNDAFYWCSSLPSVTIPDSVTNIGEKAFLFCRNLTNVSIGNSITSIGYDTFAGCSMPSVTIPNSVTNIGVGAFSGCRSLTRVTIGNNVASIGTNAFGGCTKLPSVTIPNSVTSIGSGAFLNCTNLTSVYFPGNAPGADSTMFSGDNSVTIYYLPGTTGWGLTFDGRPTALWFLPNPIILNYEPSFGVHTNKFSFVISWATNIPVVVEACTNLASPVWHPVATNTLTSGSSYFSDAAWTNFHARYYRLRSP